MSKIHPIFYVYKLPISQSNNNSHERGYSMRITRIIMLFSILRLCIGQLLAEDASTNYNISTRVEVSETGINRFLQNQYSTNSIPQTVSGTINGVTYTLNLSLPKIILLQNEMKFHMEVGIVSSIGNSNIVVEPTINIPPWNISLTSISSTLANLSTVVNALSIDYRLKTAIINAYNSLNLTLYPSQLVKQVNTDLFKQQSIKLVDPVFSIQVTILPGIMRFTLTTYLSSSAPIFKTFIGGYVGDDHIFFSCNLQSTVKEIIVVNLGGTLLYHGYPNVVCQKYQTSADVCDINMGDLGIGTGNSLIVKVRFETDNTWFSRTYSSVPVNQAWVLPTSSIN
jgi:hypothetical protein